MVASGRDRRSLRGSRSRRENTSRANPSIHRDRIGRQEAPMEEGGAIRNASRESHESANVSELLYNEVPCHARERLRVTRGGGSEKGKTRVRESEKRKETRGEGGNRETERKRGRLRERARRS